MTEIHGTYEIFGRFLNQPVGQFFVGVMPASILRYIAHEDIRRLELKSERKYIGIERPLSKERVIEIEKYISTVDATFPNSIIVSMKSENVENIDYERNTVTIKVEQNTATLIDGLHRLAGFSELNWDGFELIVSIFFDLEEEDKALIFSTINLKQTKVTKSLVYDLFDLATTRSPYKTSHEIAKTLNYADSPFFHRIKLLGVNPKRENNEVIYKGVLTQGTFVERLSELITRDAMVDRDRIKKGLPIERFSNEKELGLIFRGFFADNQDDVILKIMLNYFEAVRDTFPNEWRNLENPLSKTIGYIALMNLLKELGKIGLSQGTLSRNFFLDKLSNAKGKITFSFDEYPASGAGATNLARDFKKYVFGS
jgi:DGQHR domain-containing protein